MKVSMPSGRAHGWGIAGEYLTKEIAKLPYLEGVTLHCISGHDFRPMNQADWDRINIGYCFFENDIEALRHTRRAAREWDFIVAGSSWCEYQLRIGGVRQTATVLQGIDPVNFHVLPPREDDGRFIVFSGGKFEYRKGQDLVIAAMRVFMQRHKDAYLVCSWINQWPFSLNTMVNSTQIAFHASNDDCLAVLQHTLHENGVPLDRVYLAPLIDNTQMHQLYQQTDIGLFPNRCEGGNNMVMCEYMACGRTVIASDATGHADVITTQNALPLTSYTPFVVNDSKGHPSAIWHQAAVEEIIEQLEHAYQNRELCQKKGVVAAEDMKNLAWDKAAREFHAIGAKIAASVSRSRTGEIASSKAIEKLEETACVAKHQEKKHCRVCDKPAFMVFEDKRQFFMCQQCNFIFSDNTLSVVETEKHYQGQHSNTFDWLACANSILEAVRFAVAPRKIFDFGSGSGHLTNIFKSMGFSVNNYEPMLHGDFKIENYDNDFELVILNEVIEHIDDILKSIDHVYHITKPGGIIFISTLMTDGMINHPDRFQDLFSKWWYKDDQTHISFFCVRTFEYICGMRDRYHLKLVAISTNGVAIQKV